MPNHEDDTRFSLFGPRQRVRTETLTRSDADPEEPDERAAARTVWDGDAVDDPSDVEFDRTWHVLLMQMLGRLEYGRTSLADPAHRRMPTAAVVVASALVNQVADFIAANVDAHRHARPIADALAAAGRFLTAAQVAGDPGPKRGLFGFLGGKAAPEADSKLQECMWVLRDMPLVLERYFVLLGGCFRGQKLALDWVDTSGVYITELKRTLHWVDGFAN